MKGIFTIFNQTSAEMKFIYLCTKCSTTLYLLSHDENEDMKWFFCKGRTNPNPILAIFPKERGRTWKYEANFLESWSNSILAVCGQRFLQFQKTSRVIFNKKSTLTFVFSFIHLCLFASYSSTKIGNRAPLSWRRLTIKFLLTSLFAFKILKPDKFLYYVFLSLLAVS